MGAKIAYRCEKKSLILQSGLMGANTANRLKTKTLILQGGLVGAQAADRLRARRQGRWKFSEKTKVGALVYLLHKSLNRGL